MVLELVVHVVCPPDLRPRNGLGVARRGRRGRRVERRGRRVERPLVRVAWRLVGRLVRRLVIGGRILGGWPHCSSGFGPVIIEVSHDVGEYCFIVGPIPRRPTLGIVHVWVTRSMNLADSSKMRGASLSMVATWYESSSTISVTSRLEILDRINAELDAGTTWSSFERRSSTGWVTSGRSRMTELQAISWE